jgi:hypothetical protein
MNKPYTLKTNIKPSSEPGLLRRAFRRFRLPLRAPADIEQAAARNRAQRLFEVNFRHSWTR